MLFALNLLRGQVVEGFDLMQYPAKAISLEKKSPIKWATNPYKKRIKEIEEGYEMGEVNFAGNYIIIIWSRGVDTVEGVMVDSRSGVLYKTPFTAANTSNKCQEEDDIFDRYLFLPNSRVLVTSVCNKKVQKDTKKINQIFYFYLWDEASKKFSLQKTIKKQR